MHCQIRANDYEAGGYEYPWTSGKVLGPLIVGILMLFFAFPAWEIWGTSKPMVPRQIFEGQRVVALALIIVFIAGKLVSPQPTIR